MCISIVIPVYNEVENVEPLYEAICPSMEDAGLQFEVIFVDDCSQDGTLDLLRAIAARDDRVRVVELRGNFGQTIALRTGIELSRGEIIAVMDGDMQNDPRDIPALVEKLNEGYDVVSGWRRDRNDPLISRKVPSKIANWLMRTVTRVPIHDTGCSLKVFRAELLRKLPLYSDMHRFIPAISMMATDRIAEVVVRHHARKFGISKYGLTRIIKVIPDLVTLKMLVSFSRRPMHWFGGWAALFFLLSVTTGTYVAYCCFACSDAPLTVLLSVTALLGFASVHLAGAGIFAELIIQSEPSHPIEPLVDVRLIRREDPIRDENHE